MFQEINPASILDIGANVSVWSKEAKEKWPNAIIHMVEANPECEPFLKQSGIPYTMALLSDTEKDAIFYQRRCGGTSTGDSLYREDTPWYADDQLVETPMRTTTLDRLFPDQAFDYLKLDVQASELDIIKGGPILVQKAKWIQLEVPAKDAKPYNIGSPTYQEVMNYMASIGFCYKETLEDLCHPITRETVQHDILFEKI